MEFRCLYCFEKIRDDEVHFRSERVSKDDDNPLSEGFGGDYNRFELMFEGSAGEKEILRSKYREWEFFCEKPDSKYEKYWEKFGGTTEKNSKASEHKGIIDYHRMVIDPRKTDHKTYLFVNGDGSPLNRSRDDGMVEDIQLISGETCTTRVCPHCHNPLPINYGRYETKSITMVGISGAGKTVYLSQLLKGMATYLARVGLSMVPASMAIHEFIDRNKVQKGERLPGGTPAGSFEQPLCFQISINEYGEVRRKNLILYDVAGEEITDKSLAHIAKYAKFIQHSDGIIYLTDPEQFTNIVAMKKAAGKMVPDNIVEPSKTMDSIFHMITAGGTTQRTELPIAVSISKVDAKEVVSAMQISDAELAQRAIQEVEPVKAENGMYQKVFNAKEYNALGEGLKKFMFDNALALDINLHDNFSNYAYFSISSLGCECETLEGTNTYTPKNVPSPKRIEEPLFWLLYRFGFLQKNTDLYLPNPDVPRCPHCDATRLKKYDINQDESFAGLFGFIKKWKDPKKDHDKECEVCGHTWKIKN